MTDFVVALERGELLTRGSLNAMFTPRAVPRIRFPSPLAVSGYGYDVFIETLAGHPARFHHGDNPGHRSFLVRLPEQDTAIAVLTRDEHTGPYTTLSALTAGYLTVRLGTPQPAGMQRDPERPGPEGKIGVPRSSATSSHI
ncbi:beta-lactamase family protein [Streptomyces uncialis]|uniref:serine hydrolase n=1 Tax=Streptomyces uncialis TaxID=1048205 RepID=UPI002E35828A|nr:serine hydrolase [Streptomyces uncialis]